MSEPKRIETWLAKRGVVCAYGDTKDEALAKLIDYHGPGTNEVTFTRACVIRESERIIGPGDAAIIDAAREMAAANATVDVESQDAEAIEEISCAEDRFENAIDRVLAAVAASPDPVYEAEREVIEAALEADEAGRAYFNARNGASVSQAEFDEKAEANSRAAARRFNAVRKLRELRKR